MTQTNDPTTRPEAERNAIFHLRNALLWHMKVQLGAAQTVSAEQFEEMVRTAAADAQAITAEIASLYPAVDALQKVGWRALDAFDRAVPPMPAAQATPPGQATQAAPPPDGAAPNRVASNLDSIGRDLDKGFKDLGGALDGLFEK